MPYRIAGIDVHKKKLAVVVADVEVHDEYQFERRWFGSNRTVATAGGMADRAASRGSSDGIHGAILEAGMGGARALLEAVLSESGRCRPDVGNPASGASLVESWSARAQERFSRRRTSGEAIGCPGADLELCARCRTAFVADTDAHQVSTDAGQSPFAES